MIYKTHALTRADIFDYIEVFYNRRQRHNHPDGISAGGFQTDRISLRLWGNPLIYLLAIDVHMLLPLLALSCQSAFPNIVSAVFIPRKKVNPTYAFSHGFKTHSEHKACGDKALTLGIDLA